MGQSTSFPIIFKISFHGYFGSINQHRFETHLLFFFCLCQNDDEEDDEEEGDDAEELLGKGARSAALLADRTRVSVYVCLNM